MAKKRTNEAVGVTFPSVLLLIGSSLLFSRQFLWGCVALGLALALALKRSMENINAAEKLEIRYNVLSPEDLVAELEQLDAPQSDDATASSIKPTSSGVRDEIDHAEAIQQRRMQYLGGLSALARKYTKSNCKKDLALSCQHIAFTTLRLYPDDNEVVAGTISLLALITKESQVRKRYKYQQDDFGLDRPILVLKRALKRAKHEEDEATEQTLAEIVRKGCLFLGAVCNDDKNLGMAATVVQEGGLEFILEAAEWFRFHEDVTNWALWAIFTLCFDQTRIKAQLIRLNGIHTICESMKNNATTLEVNRHGIALLFDLLRENECVEGIKWDPWEIRRIALASGLHDVVFEAMNEFSDSMDIMMMGQEILVGTGFSGDIPVFRQI